MLQARQGPAQLMLLEGSADVANKGAGQMSAGVPGALQSDCKGSMDGSLDSG